MLLAILKLIGYICMLPLGFGVLLLLLFITYCILFAWLGLFPIFSGHFSVMSNIWFLGLRIVFTLDVWKMAGIGVVLLLIASIFTWKKNMEDNLSILKQKLQLSSFCYLKNGRLRDLVTRESYIKSEWKIQGI